MNTCRRDVITLTRYGVYNKGSVLKWHLLIFILQIVMNMSEDDPRRMDEIRKYAAIYGRFDCKRKPEKPLTLHEVSRIVSHVFNLDITSWHFATCYWHPSNIRKLLAFLKHFLVSVCPSVCINSYSLRERFFIKLFINIKLKLSIWRSCKPWSPKSGVQTMFRSFFTSALHESEYAASKI